MDDEEFIRKVGKRVLSELGFNTETAEDGEEALDMYTQALEKGDPFDMVIMDLTIPGGLGGKETIQKLIEIDPQTKAVVSSGYSTDPVMSEYEKYGFSGCIQKPYEIDELRSVLNQVLSTNK
jgi:CheY-like chemotaxis protein